MALRQIRITGDEILRKKSKEVKKITPRLLELIEDMKETMYDANGVGLAAVQVGVLRRIVVIDIGDGPIVMINPEITEKSEEEYIETEGCLSVPDEQGFTRRPVWVKVRYTDPEGAEMILETEEKFLSKAVCHELDHLDGVLYTDLTFEPSEEEMQEIARRRQEEMEKLQAEQLEAESGNGDEE